WGIYWLIKHHDASVPADSKATFRPRYPFTRDETTTKVPPTYAGVLRGWGPPLIVSMGQERVLATEVVLPDHPTSDAIITVQRGYNNTPLGTPSNSSAQYQLTKSGRISGESTTPGSMWIGSSFQNLRMTDHGGVLPAAAALARRSNRVRGIFQQRYNLF